MEPGKMEGPVAQLDAFPTRVGSTHSPSWQFSRELVGYGVASAAALGVDVTLLKVLVDRAGWHYLAAATLSFIAGAGVVYGLSLRLAFHSRRIQNRALEFGCFAALGIVGLFVNGASIWVGIRVIGLTLVPAKLIAAGCTFATNFVLRRALLFSPRKLRQ